MLNRRTLITGSLHAGSAILLTACAPTPPPPADNTPGAAKVLLAYFSRAGENYANGGRVDLAVGNTEVLANLIATAASVTVYRIDAADPYPHSYDATVARNVDEQRHNARPAIANPLPDLAGYDIVLLGSPIWNVRPPMIMGTFVEGVDLAGKMVHPFVTYAVSGLGTTVADYTALAPRATIGEPLAVRGEDVGNARSAVDTWLKNIGLTAPRRPSGG